MENSYPECYGKGIRIVYGLPALEAWDAAAWRDSAGWMYCLIQLFAVLLLSERGGCGRHPFC